MNVYKMTILGNEYYSKPVVFFKNMFLVTGFGSTDIT